MLSLRLRKEIKSLESITNKHNKILLNYYHKCYKKIPMGDYSTQYEHDTYETRINDVVLDYIRDYALFDDDNSDLLRNFNPEINDS